LQHRDRGGAKFRHRHAYRPLSIKGLCVSAALTKKRFNFCTALTSLI
jgi:hypothetical protein